MTITLTPEIEQALAEQARQQGTTPESLALDALRQWFATSPARPDTADAVGSANELLPDNLSRACFAAGAHATRHVWDTAEEDEAWAHL